MVGRPKKPHLDRSELTRAGKVRVYVSAVFPNMHKNNNHINDRSDYHVILSVANDTAKTPKEVVRNPMLVYRTVMTTKGERTIYIEGYTEQQWNRMQEVANKDGDSLVFNAELIRTIDGAGFRIDTQSLQSTDIPFNRQRHIENTLKARELDKQNQSQKTTGNESSLDGPDDELER